MRSRDAINAPEALVLTMVLVSAADGGMTDREIGVMSGLVQTLPAFQDFTTRSTRRRDRTRGRTAARRRRTGPCRAADARRADTQSCAKPPMHWPARSSPAAREHGGSRWTCWNSCVANWGWTS